MKKLILVAAVILETTAVAFAQSSASTDVNVTAAVIPGITLTASGALDFGNVVAGTTPAALGAQTNASAPMFTTTANGSTALTVTYGSSVSLTGPGTALTFTPSVYGSSSSANQGTSTLVSTGGTVTTSGTSGSAGSYYFWLGGSLSGIPSGQALGTYTGQFTLTVAY